MNTFSEAGAINNVGDEEEAWGGAECIETTKGNINQKWTTSNSEQRWNYESANQAQTWLLQMISEQLDGYTGVLNPRKAHKLFSLVLKNLRDLPLRFFIICRVLLVPRLHCLRMICFSSFCSNVRVHEVNTAFHFDVISFNSMCNCTAMFPRKKRKGVRFVTGVMSGGAAVSKYVHVSLQVVYGQFVEVSFFRWEMLG